MKGERDETLQDELKPVDGEIERLILASLRVAKQDRQHQLTHLQTFSTVLIAANLAVISLLGGFFKPSVGTGDFVYCAYYASLVFLLASLLIGLAVLRPRYRATSLKEATDNPYEQHLRQEALLLGRQRWLGVAYWCLCGGLALGGLALVSP